jgi:hypothetical protein
MLRLIRWTAVCMTLLATAAMMPSGGQAQTSRSSTEPTLDLPELLTAGKLRVVNRKITVVQGRRGVHLSAGEGKGMAWVEGSDFTQGTIELEVRGKDVFQQSFVGVAFHRRDDSTYEAVYVRPFNFRSPDPIRQMHAVQYIATPEYDWPKLRQDFPEEFENPVDQSIDPTGWVRLRVVVNTRNIQIYVGQVKSPTLEVRKLGAYSRGMVGLWVDVSDGEFSNLRITPTN